MYGLSTVLWLPIVIFVPALAFNQVTNVNIHIITPIVCLVCIFYTCLGGIKAVIWTDLVQTLIMYGVLIVILIKGTRNVGGLSVVWERNYNSGRIEYPE
jgi:sodium-coupled monocarboxylate transporter 8/12